MKMVNYGSVDYWNDRYKNETGAPFDWLFDYNDLAGILASIVTEKDKPILLPGCGNAPFSEELYFQGKFENLVNIDISNEAIDQMKAKFDKVPGLEFHVMDVLDLAYKDGEFPYVIDKSLVDTLMCYSNGNENTRKMIAELYRVLAPGGRYITFSLHTVEEVVPYFANAKLEWKISSFRVKSSRFQETAEGRKRSVAHTMIVCDKPDENGHYLRSYPITIEGSLTDDEYLQLLQYASEVNFQAALGKASISDMMVCLRRALEAYTISLTDETHIEPAEQHKTETNA